MTAHAKLSPSAASRWLNCPGSVALSEGMPDSGSSYADEGTACHEILETWIKGRPQLGDKASNGVDITPEMRAAAQEVIDWVDAYCDTVGAPPLSEVRIDASTALGLPEKTVWGTSDVVVESDFEVLVADAKFGHHPVPAQDNPQLMIYALGVLERLQTTSSRVRLAILQPQCGEPKEAVYTVEQLRQWAADNAPKAQAAFSGGPLVAGPTQCRWCKASPVCPETRKAVLALAQSEFAGVVAHRTPEELAELLEKLELLEPAAAAIRAHAMQMISLGTEVPGWKRVAGRSIRKWTNPAEAEAVLKTKIDPFETTLVSPAQAESRLAEVAEGPTKKVRLERARALVELLATKPEGRPALVRSTDPRPALAADFDHLDLVENID